MVDIAQLGFRVDSSGVRRAATDLDTLRASGERTARTNAALATSYTNTASAIAQAKSQMLALAGVSGIVGSSANVIKMADEYKNLDAKLHLVTKSQQEFNDVQGKLAAMADANRQSLSATIDLYSGIAPSLQKAGQSQENILKAVDSVNKALVVG
ncbi:MAG: tape measure protein, partial [Betaproteobacteria bacterium]